MRIIKKILFPLIWLKGLQGNITSCLTRKLAKKTGADKPNRFKTWKLKQPWWKQLLIELPIYILILWILNLIFNTFGYEISPW
jgi:hypothetical protein|tara:strand:- start:7549 stop:7797 length:249 start_codon:yes stop_codon:yes gene_type:complete